MVLFVIVIYFFISEYLKSIKSWQFKNIYILTNKTIQDYSQNYNNLLKNRNDFDQNFAKK
ncbi:MAG: hypothetical protein EAZ97_08350 [Bacteroidetes bacterium]|nr:MAG: hypothetical protein EAZ97_08350 [Bacteroidota bacterium]